MQVTINHQTHHLTAPFPVHLQELLHRCVPELKAKGIAVALNNQVIPRPEWEQTAVPTQADILIITATQGG